MKSPFPFLRRHHWLAAFALLALGGGAFWYWGDPQRRFERWLEHWIRRSYTTALGPTAPFELIRVRLHSQPKGLATGHVDELELVFRHHPPGLPPSGLEIRFDGPVELNQNLLRLDLSQGLEVKYDPKVTTTVPKGSAWTVPEILLHLSARASPTGGLDGLTIEPEVEKWAAQPGRLTVEGPTLKVEWKDGSLVARFGAKSIAWQPTPDRAINVMGLAGTIELPLVLDPLQIGPDLQFHGSARGAELLWDSFYSQVDLRPLPLRVRATLDLEKSHSSLPASAATVEVGPEHRPWVTVHAEPLRRKNGAAHALNLDLRLDQLKLAGLWKSLVGALPEDAIDPGLRGLEITRGTLSAQAHTVLDLEGQLDPGGLHLGGDVRLDDLAVLGEGGRWGVRGIQVRAPLPTQGTETGSVAVKAFRILRLEGAVPPTPLRVTALGTQPPRYDVELPEGLPLRLPGVPWKMGSAKVRIGGGPPRIETRLHVGPVVLKDVAAPLCVSARNTRGSLGESQVTVDFPLVVASPGEVRLEGGVQVNAMGGQLNLTGLKLFRLLSAVPEMQFSTEWSGFSLHELGLWSGFGDMTGQMRGYFRNVVFQGWLPTQYEFHAELAPQRDDKVKFSWAAVDNLVRVLSGENPRSRMPSLAAFIAFDVPEFFTPGFALDWAGVTLTSKDGYILLEDVTPQEFYERTHERFFIHGLRVKVPLHAYTYPVVLDAYALANYTRKMADYFINIRQDSSNATGDTANAPATEEGRPPGVRSGESCIPVDPPERH
ncbi:MAG TPA: hypothetical protein VL588_02370 [Bdellovibrionota bacterium]|nr:hypothetical protein [Bdellovibrionota bacterium]